MVEASAISRQICWVLEINIYVFFAEEDEIKKIA